MLSLHSSAGSTCWAAAFTEGGEIDVSTCLQEPGHGHVVEDLWIRSVIPVSGNRHVEEALGLRLSGREKIGSVAHRPSLKS
ncbi:hypothetical protein M0R45_010295 [Rubus argutus]|uniref:Uncharacterized protein n=1 Tax=Rubus argutus TaxID=59490 RepID=A0AAW1Y9Z0_RUBAR